MKDTIIRISEDGNYIVEVRPRTDLPFGYEFYCKYCKRKHLHGKGLGSRVSHCTNPESPLYDKSYIMELAQ